MRLKSHQIWSTLFLGLSVSVLSACTQSSPTSTEQVPSSNQTTTKVVATNSILCDMTRQIADTTVDLTCLIKPGTDPHIYEVTPEDRKAIEQANLILYGGYNFEPSIVKLIQSSSNAAPKIAVDEQAVPKPQQFEEDGQIEPDPHVFNNAQNGIRMVEVIESNLAKVNPTHADHYAQNAQALTTELSQIDTWIKSQIATIPAASRTLITTHDALGYYSTAYDIPVETLEGISTEEKPTATQTKELIDTIKQKKVPTIFAELSVNPKLLETVARDANVKIAEQELYVDGLGETGSKGDTYPKMLISNTKTIVEGLGGQYTPFKAK